MHFLLKLFSAFHIADSFSASSEVQMYVPFPSTLKPNLLLAACMYAAFFLAADAFVILSLMFNYFPLLKYCLQSFFSVRKSSAHTSCKNKVFAF